MSDGKLLCVGPDDVAAVWPMVAHLIDASYAELDETTPDVRSWLMDRGGLLWVYAAEGKVIAAATTSLVQMRGGKALRLVACGGQDNDAGAALWRSCMAQIEDYAKAEGCYKVLLDGRRGWVRILTDYDPKCVSFEKRI